MRSVPDPKIQRRGREFGALRSGQPVHAVSTVESPGFGHNVELLARLERNATYVRRVRTCD